MRSRRHLDRLFTLGELVYFFLLVAHSHAGRSVHFEVTLRARRLFIGLKLSNSYEPASQRMLVLFFAALAAAVTLNAGVELYDKIAPGGGTASKMNIPNPSIVGDFTFGVRNTRTGAIDGDNVTSWYHMERIRLF
jgi:hypothetical protein